MAFDKKRRRWSLVGIGLLLAVGVLLLVPTALRFARGTSRLDQAIGRLKAQRDMTAFDQKMKGLTPDEAKKQQMAMAAQGLFRLSDAQLIRRLELVNSLLKKAPRDTKRDFATGRNTSGLLHLVNQLKPQEIDDWAGITLDALQAEAADAPPKTFVAKDKATEAMVAIFKKGPNDKERLLRAFLSPSTVDDVEAVWATTKLYGLILAADDPYKGIMARAILQNDTP